VDNINFQNVEISQVMVLPPVIDVIFGVVHEINHSAIGTMWTPGAASQGRRA
jgi:hypothetical protein